MSQIPPMPLFFLFVAVPILEIWLFLVVGEQIGVWRTVGVVILTAAAGTWLVRSQGMAVLQRAQEQMNRGALPAGELIDGVLILAAGLLLLTPGFFTDAVGFALLIPLTRALVRSYAVKKLQERFVATNIPPGTPASRIEIVDDSDATDADS